MSRDMSSVWRNEAVLKLIDLYHTNELLWNNTDRDFRNKKKKNEAWLNMAKKMDMPRKEVEAKMHTLRSQFVRETKKGRSNNGDASWFAYDALKFLSKKPNPGYKDTIDDQSDESEDITSKEEIEEVPQPVQTQQVHQQSTTQMEPPPKRAQTAPTIDGSSQTPRKRRLPKEYRLEDPYGDTCAGKRSLGCDEFDFYGQYVGSELREVPDIYSVLMAKHYINTVLINVRLGKYRECASDHSQPTPAAETKKDFNSRNSSPEANGVYSPSMSLETSNNNS